MAKQEVLLLCGRKKNIHHIYQCNANAASQAQYISYIPSLVQNKAKSAFSSTSQTIAKILFVKREKARFFLCRPLIYERQSIGIATKNVELLLTEIPFFFFRKTLSNCYFFFEKVFFCHRHPRRF